MKLATRPWVILGAMAVTGIVLGVLLELGVSQYRGEQLEQVLSEEPETYALPPQPDRLPVEALDGIPAYPNLDEPPRALARKMLAQGQPMDIAYFTTDDSVGDVIEYYRLQFVDAGVPYVGEMFSEASGYVGYMDYDTERVHLVSAIMQGDKTVVFPSVGEPGRLLDGTAKVPDDVPVSKDAVANVVLEFQDEGRTQQTISSTFRTGSVAEIAAFYREQFAARGWQVSDSAATNNESTVLIAQQPKKVARVDIRRDPAGPGVVVFINLSRGTS